jgi:hypothetical protein
VATLKPWDQYVDEARVEDLVLPLPDGSSLTIKQPTYGAIDAVNAARQVGDLDAQLSALCGEENTGRLKELFATSPAGAVQAFLRDVVKEFGLGDDLGESSASPI